MYRCKSALDRLVPGIEVLLLVLRIGDPTAIVSLHVYVYMLPICSSYGIRTVHANVGAPTAYRQYKYVHVPPYRTGTGTCSNGQKVEQVEGICTSTSTQNMCVYM